jgi:4'-phosphopantetheinyl transferase EntD
VIEEILPDTAIAVEAFDDPPGTELFAAEEAAIGRAVDKRRREFTTARGCARAALERLGLPPGPIPSGERGEPIWPAGLVGSITHCDGYRACAVARASDLVTIGIDAEPHKPLPDGLLGDVSLPEEMGWLRELARHEPDTHWDRLLFSAKESVYKAWFPLTGEWLGFEDAVLVVAPLARRFSARLLVPGPVVSGRRIPGFAGRWLVRDGLIVTAVTLKAMVSFAPPVETG